MIITSDIFALYMVYYFMFFVVFIKTGISTKTVSDYRRAFSDRFFNNRLQGIAVNFINNLSHNIALSFKNTEDRNLINVAVNDLSFRGVFIPFFTANKCLVNLNSSGDRFIKRFSFNSVSNPVQHKPCSLLSDVNISTQLKRRNTFFMCSEYINSHKPFLQRQSGIFKYSSDLYSKLFPTVSASKNLTASDFIDFPVTSAMRTNRLTVPSCLNKIIDAGYFIRELFLKFYNTFEIWLVHINTLNEKLNYELL